MEPKAVMLLELLDRGATLLCFQMRSEGSLQVAKVLKEEKTMLQPGSFGRVSSMSKRKMT
jgi:hypothetical protein